MPVPKNKPNPGQGHKQTTSRRRQSQQFDRAAATVSTAYSAAPQRLRAEQQQALDPQPAGAEIMRIVGQSPTGTRPVFDTILQHLDLACVFEGEVPLAIHRDVTRLRQAMTANAMQVDREACIAAGMDDYLTQPIRIEALVQALCRTVVRWDA